MRKYEISEESKEYNKKLLAKHKYKCTPKRYK